MTPALVAAERNIKIVAGRIECFANLLSTICDIIKNIMLILFHVAERKVTNGNALYFKGVSGRFGPRCLPGD